VKYQHPETLDGLSLDELNTLHKAAWEEYTSIATKDDADISDADLADLDALDGHLSVITAAATALEEAAAERADKLAAARGKVDAAASTPDPEPEPEPEPEPQSDEDDGDSADEDAEAETTKEPVMASASSVAKAASQARADSPVLFTRPASVITAAANLPSIASQEQFDDLLHVARVFGQKAAKGPSAGSTLEIRGGEAFGLSKDAVRQGVAKIKKAPEEFAIDMGMNAEEQLRLVDEVARESRLSGGSLARSVLAAGGWCAPSETVYDFCSFETVSGLIDIPTVNIRRGGLRFTKGPDYASIAADPEIGFHQTEAQAIAGTPKVCYAVECPPFEDIRLDVVGFCITAGILTNVGYPELIRRVLEIGAVAHAHKVNKYVIDAIVADAGAPINAVEAGSATADVLDALNLQAWRIRTTYSMGANATVEVVLPTWAKAVIQADLSYRTGVDLINVSDAQINAYFSARGLRVQFVEDFQTLTSGTTGTWTEWPASVTALLYPAGSFIKGTTDVIDLDTIYDSVNISTNTYTAAFFEEGILVANRCAGAVAVTIDLTHLGRTGAADITDLVAAP
jgi:hypothetical protein